MNKIKRFFLRVLYDSVLNEHRMIRHRCRWTSFYDKDGNKLERSIERPLIELEDSHLDNIVTFQLRNGFNKPTYWIKDEILLRQLYPEYKIENNGS